MAGTGKVKKRSTQTRSRTEGRRLLKKKRLRWSGRRRVVRSTCAPDGQKIRAQSRQTSLVEGLSLLETPYKYYFY